MTKELIQNELLELASWITKMYPIGKTFTYLERNLIVIEHKDAAIVCDYLSADGIILTRIFPIFQFPLLKAIYQ